MSYPKNPRENNALRALLATSVMTAMSWCERQYTLTGGRGARNPLILLALAPVIFGMRRAIDTAMNDAATFWSDFDGDGDGDFGAAKARAAAELTRLTTRYGAERALAIVADTTISLDDYEAEYDTQS